MLNIEEVFQISFVFNTEKVKKAIEDLDLITETKNKIDHFLRSSAHKTDLKEHPLVFIFNYLRAKVLILKMIEFLLLEKDKLELDAKKTKEDENLNDHNSQSINETVPPKDLDYLKIGVLIAQGKLTKTKEWVFQYQNKNFNKQDIIKQLESDLKIKSVRQYIEGTFGADADSTLSNDFFNNKTKIKKTVEYCLFHNIQITEAYQSRFDNLE